MPLVSLFPPYRQQWPRKVCSPREKKWGSEKVLEEGYSQYAQLDMFRLKEKKKKRNHEDFQTEGQMVLELFFEEFEGKNSREIGWPFFLNKEYLLVQKLKKKGYKVKSRFLSSCLFSAQTLSLPTCYPSTSALEIYLLSSVFLLHQQQCFSTSALGMGGPIPPLALTTHRPPCYRWRSQEDREVAGVGWGGTVFQVCKA